MNTPVRPNAFTPYEIEASRQLSRGARPRTLVAQGLVGYIVVRTDLVAFDVVW